MIKGIHIDIFFVFIGSNKNFPFNVNFYQS